MERRLGVVREGEEKEGKGEGEEGVWYERDERWASVGGPRE